MKWVKRLSLAFVGLVLVVFALMGYLYATRGTPTRSVFALGDSLGPPAVSDSTFLRSIELLTKTDLTRGHTVQPLFNGNGTYPRLWQDLRSAQRSIVLQLYYCKPGALADSLKHILIDRARAGVRTLLLFDAFGAQDISDEYKDSLRSVGVRVAEFRPLKWYALHKAQHRSHIRVVVIDGNVGYTGGFGLADMWQGNGHKKEEWRETNVRFTGPSVRQLLAAFSAAWAEATGELLTGRWALDIATPGDTTGSVAGLLHAEPAVGSTVAERFVALTVTGARKTLFITNAYFVPDDDFRRMLRAAARRGVDVRVLTAGKNTDVKIVRLAARRRYAELLQDGVRIYEYRPTMIHSKTLVADGIWSTIGTMNIDNRSLALNDESNLLVYDRAVAAILERQFFDDLRYSDEIRLPTFTRRSLFTKVLERVASGAAKVL
jgi:cardiolipin synthase